MSLPQVYACPRCNRRLAVSGELTFDGRKAAVFQCDECITEVAFGRDTIDSAFTFAVDEAGRVFDPTAADVDQDEG